MAVKIEYRSTTNVFNALSHALAAGAFPGAHVGHLFGPSSHADLLAIGLGGFILHRGHVGKKVNVMVLVHWKRL